MNFYWKYQRLIDAGLALTLSVIVWAGGKMGLAVFEYRPKEIGALATSWFSATLTLFGLVAATIAFVFSAIEGPEFKILRASQSRKQLWDIFSFTMISLCISSLWCAVLSLIRLDLIETDGIIIVNGFVIFLDTILVVKFTWVMTQIIAVKSR